jgi:hypothetical protein
MNGFTTLQNGPFAEKKVLCTMNGVRISVYPFRNSHTRKRFIEVKLAAITIAPVVTNAVMVVNRATQVACLHCKGF